MFIFARKKHREVVKKGKHGISHEVECGHPVVIFCVSVLSVDSPPSPRFDCKNLPGK